MGAYYQLKDARNRNHFRIDYPYYGLFGSADVTPRIDNSELMYECHLLNGTVMVLKKADTGRKWIDTALNRETQLASVIGAAIEDFLKSAQNNM